MTLVVWAKGLLAAIISSVSTTILASLASNATGTPLKWEQIGTVAASSALVGACLYLKQAPLPDEVEAPSKPS